jgi:hypothetical protein
MSNQNRPSLNDVQHAFAQWRASGQRRRTPAALRAQAVGLLAAHSVSEVMTALRVDHRRLSRWRREVAAPVNDFVELPAAALEEAIDSVAPAPVSLTLTRQGADGSTVSIAGELNAVQWRWALGLLQEQEA